MLSELRRYIPCALTSNLYTVQLPETFVSNQQDFRVMLESAGFICNEAYGADMNTRASQRTLAKPRRSDYLGAKM